MKSLKPILICVAVILAVVLLYVIFAFIVPNKNATEEPESGNAETPVISTGSNVPMLSQNYEDLQSIEFLPADGESFRVDISVSDEGNYSYKVTPAAEHFDYDTSLFRSLLYTVSKVSAHTEITDDVEDLSAYGLDEPWYTVRCTYKGSTVTELSIGKQTLVDKNYYCKTNLSDSVYVVGSYTVQLLTRNELQYRDATLFPTYEGDEIYDKTEWYRLTLRDGTEIEVAQDPELDDEINVISSSYVMHSPYVGSVNDENFISSVADIVAPIKKVEILCDITDAEFAEYGFDTPARLEMRDTLGNELNLLIGDPCENPVYTYAMIDGTYTVLVVESSCLTWLDVKPIELFSRVGWLYNITDISQIDLDFKTERFASIYDELAENYTIKMTHGSYVNDAGNTINTVEATMNGEPLSETNCRRLYVRIMNMRVIDLLPEGTNISAAPDVVFTLTATEGKTAKMELVPINDRDYAMIIDGKAEFYIYQKNLNSLIAGLKENAAGFELDTNYSAY